MLKQLLTGIIAVSASNLVFAGSQTFDFVHGHSANIEHGNEHGIGNGSYLDMTVGGVEVVVSAWSSTSSSGTCGSTDPTCQGGRANDPDPYIRRADLKQYGGGLGAVNADENDDQPNHAFDSILGPSSSVDYDMALLQFDTEVLLEEIDIDWKGSDSDITVLNYAGTSDLSGVPFSSASTWYELLSQGWNHVGNYADLTTSNNQTISGTFESKYWLIGVYNPAFGNNWSYANDAIKLAGVVTSTHDPGTQVPEPATFALLLAGLLGFGRKKLKS